MLILIFYAAIPEDARDVATASKALKMFRAENARCRNGTNAFESGVH
jgi:hypothetical protein